MVVVSSILAAGDSPPAAKPRCPPATTVGKQPVAGPAEGSTGVGCQKAAPDGGPGTEAEAAPEATVPKPALVRRDPKEFEKAMRRMAQAPANEVFSFARYRDPEPVHPLADDARFSTVRARVGVLSTRDPLDQVSGYYSAAFKGRAFPLYAGNHDAYSSYVAYRDPADGIMRVVTLVNNGNGTTVIAAVGDPLNLLARSRSDEMPPGWQLPPGAGRPLTMEFRDGAHVERTTYFEVRDMAPADVRTFYANALASTGWTRIGDDELPSDPTDPALAFQHERDRCALQVFKGAGKAMVSITCRKTSGGGP